jgi:hypothetical protein
MVAPAAKTSARVNSGNRDFPMFDLLAFKIIILLKQLYRVDCREKGSSLDSGKPNGGSDGGTTDKEIGPQFPQSRA